MTTITSLRKLEVEEKVEEKVEVEVEVWRRRRSRRRGGDKGAPENSCTNTYAVSMNTYFPPFFISLTPKSIPAGTKNSCSEGFMLSKHKQTNIPTMMEPFAPPAA